MKLKIPYLQWRNGRPRWSPGPHLRAAGWQARDLKDDAGAWLELVPAIEAAEAINAEVAAWRGAAKAINAEGRTAGQVQPPPVVAPKCPSRTARHLWEVYSTSPHHTRLAASTQDDYGNKMKPFLAEFGDRHVGAFQPSHFYTWWEELYEERGHHMANGVIAVVRAMFSYGKKKGWRTDNPVRELGLETPPPRQVLWLPDEVSAIVAAADATGEPSVGDAVVVAVHSGQRLGDVLALPDPIFEQQRIRLSQAKMKSRGGVLIDAPMTPALIQRVAEIRARKREMSITRIDCLILREDTGGAYDINSFGKAFRRTRDVATETCPGLADKRFQDLRDTAVTRLALADCTMAQIAAITGHSLESITRIMKHYLVLQPEMADAAIAKLSAWLEAQGIAL